MATVVAVVGADAVCFTVADVTEVAATAAVGVAACEKQERAVAPRPRIVIPVDRIRQKEPSIPLRISETAALQGPATMVVADVDCSVAVNDVVAGASPDCSKTNPVTAVVIRIVVAVNALDIAVADGTVADTIRSFRPIVVADVTREPVRANVVAAVASLVTVAEKKDAGCSSVAGSVVEDMRAVTSTKAVARTPASSDSTPKAATIVVAA